MKPNVLHAHAHEVTSFSIRMYEDKETYDRFLGRETEFTGIELGAKPKPIEELHLYRVVYADGDRDKYVIAESPQGAISQATVKTLDGVLAQRIPLMLRGWGRDNF